MLKFISINITILFPLIGVYELILTRARRKYKAALMGLSHNTNFKNDPNFTRKQNHTNLDIPR
jgi:hypothetical protein